MSPRKRKWVEHLALRVVLGLAGLGLCSIGVGILINLQAASGTESGSDLERLFQSRTAEQMIWWAVASVLLGFAMLTNATSWMRNRGFAYAQAGFFLPATIAAVALWVSRVIALAKGQSTLAAVVLLGIVASVCLLALLRAVGITWSWADRSQGESDVRSPAA